MVKWLGVIAFVLNAAAFCVYGADKLIARYIGCNAGRGLRRVSEKALFAWAALGPLGALLGMKIWRHKTKHWYFVWGVPAILAAELGLAALLMVWR